MKILKALLLVILCYNMLYAGLDLSGTDIVTFADNSRFDASATNWAIEFWFKSSDSGNNLILVKKYGDDPGRGYEFNLTDSGRVTVTVEDASANSGYVQTTDIYDDGKWHCVFAYMSNSINLYVDNVSKGSNGSLSDTMDTSSALAFGSNGYDGQIAGFRTFSASGMGTWNYYRSQYQRFQLPDTNVDAHIPCWENAGSDVSTIDHPRLTDNLFSGASWGSDPTLIYEGGKLEDVRNSNIIITITWRLDYGSCIKR